MLLVYSKTDVGLQSGVCVILLKTLSYAYIRPIQAKTRVVCLNKKPEDQWSCKRSPDDWAMYKHKTYKTWKKQGQEMNLTFNIHLLSFAELVVYIYKFLGHWLQYFLKYPLFSHYNCPIEKPKLPTLTLT